MVFGDANEFLEILRGTLPYYALFFLPIFIIISSANSSEFAVYRVQQYDLHGTTFGCRSAVMNVEARTVHSPTFARRGVLARITELTIAKYREIISQGAGGLIILLPKNLSSLSVPQRQHIVELEKILLEEEVNVPTYFAIETPEVNEIYTSVGISANSEDTSSAAEAIMNSITASGFQLVVGSSQPKAIADVQVANIWGKLPGYGLEEQLPSIVIVAYYDAFSAAPGLSFGADSNGSGVVAFLELVRLFSRLYASAQTHAKYNLIFLLSGAGKFNYQGSKKFIEDNLESTEGGLVQDAAFTLCLDALSAQDELYLHVSKPPKEGSIGGNFVKALQSISTSQNPPVKFEMIHKKINLAEDVLAWEHERFSIRRLPAFTLSHHSSPKASQRSTLLDTRDSIKIDSLFRNTKILSETLARLIFNISEHEESEIFTESMTIQTSFITAWMDFLTSQPRGAQLFAEDAKHSLVYTLEQTMSQYLSDVKVTHAKPDKRDPEFVFYDVNTATMSAYSVKPALFDLFLSMAIAGYLAIFYFGLMNFGKLVFALRNATGQMKVKQG